MDDSINITVAPPGLWSINPTVVSQEKRTHLLPLEAKNFLHSGEDFPRKTFCLCLCCKRIQSQDRRTQVSPTLLLYTAWGLSIRESLRYLWLHSLVINSQDAKSCSSFPAEQRVTFTLFFVLLMTASFPTILFLLLQRAFRTFLWFGGDSVGM